MFCRKCWLVRLLSSPYISQVKIFNTLKQLFFLSGCERCLSQWIYTDQVEVCSSPTVTMWPGSAASDMKRCVKKATLSLFVPCTFIRFNQTERISHWIVRYLQNWSSVVLMKWNGTDLDLCITRGVYVITPRECELKEAENTRPGHLRFRALKCHALSVTVTLLGLLSHTPATHCISHAEKKQKYIYIYISSVPLSLRNRQESSTSPIRAPVSVPSVKKNKVVSDWLWCSQSETEALLYLGKS